MSEPTIEAAVAATAAVGDVVTFAYVDALTGAPSTRRGVVEELVGAGHLVVRPLGDYFVQVAPADVITPASTEPAPTEPATTDPTVPVSDPAAPVYPAPVPATPASEPASVPAVEPVAGVTYQLPTA